MVLRWLAVVATAGGMLAAGAPAGLGDRAWWTAAVFAATIVGFITRPVAMGPMVLVALVTLLVTGALDAADPNDRVDAIDRLLSGFGDATVWLVVAAFLLSGTVVRTGFGRRIALLLIRRCGRTTLGLGYAVAGAELALGPVIPSNTARGGGVMAPIVHSLASALGAAPAGGRRRTGAYLALVGAHANLVAAAMYLTGMAANPQLSVLADEHFGLRWDWLTWLQGSWLPGLVSMALLPWFLHRVCRPDVTDGSAAQAEADAELAAMGPWTWRQKWLGALLVGMLVAWAAEPWHGVHSAGVALVGLAAILVLQIDEWSGMAGERGAWDALVWLGGLVTMAERLEAEGVVKWFADRVQAQLSGYSGPAVAVLLALVYFFSMYGFSMLTGHIAALGSMFFVVAKAAEAPPLLTVAMISYFSNLCGCLTNYSSGPVVIYFGLGYVSTRRWLATGLAVAALHLAVWLGVGLPYWKLLGWW
jgi:DASS family divalent anion:Na+ symporter